MHAEASRWVLRWFPGVFDMRLVEVGQKAPAWSLCDQDGVVHSLRDFQGKYLVLYFYPKDDTSVCTAQACAFRDGLPKFKRSQAIVLGISPDDAASHGKFIKKHKLNFTLLTDPKAPPHPPKVCDAYGVWAEKSMYGRKYMGVVRTTYLLGPDGRVLRRWDKVRVAGHADEVLDAVRAAAIEHSRDHDGVRDDN